MRPAAGIALAGAFLILAALSFGAALLLVPGVAFVLLGAGIPPWILLASRGATVKRSLVTDRVLEGQPVEAWIEVAPSHLGLPGGEVVDPLAGATMALPRALPRLRSRRPQAVRVIARFPRRGRRRLEPPSLKLGDPLGLVKAMRHGSSGSQTLLVLPRTERIRWLRHDGGDRIRIRDGVAALEALAATEIDGLRPYRRGTPASRISWPALARGAGLLERRLRVERDAGPLVVLDVRCAGAEELVDAAVRAAASLALHLGGRGGCELLLPGDRRPMRIDPDLIAWSAAHTRLALIEGGPDAVAPSLMAHPRSGAVLYVGAENVRLPASLLASLARGGVLVLPRQLEPAIRCTPSFEVSGCRGYTLASGSLSSTREQAA